MDDLFIVLFALLVGLGTGLYVGAVGQNNVIRDDINAYGKITVHDKVYEVKEVQPAKGNND